MKTSGFREIDFSKTECKNCGKWDENSRTHIPKGKILVKEFMADRGFEYYAYPSHFYVKKDCPKCNGTGYIDENCETELELECENCLDNKESDTPLFDMYREALYPEMIKYRLIIQK